MKIPQQWLVFMGLALCAASLHATTRDVGPGQTYTTIQSCLAAATAGDVCNVHAGTYSEQLSLPASGASGSPITLQNNGSDVVTVQAASSPVVAINGRSYWTIKGLNFIYNGSDSAPVGIYNADGRSINNLTIQGTTVTIAGGSGEGYGHQIFNCNACTISGNTIHISSTTGSMDGSDMLFASNLTFTGNTIYGDPCTTQTHLEDGLVTQGVNLVITGNTLHDGCSYDNHPDGIVIQGLGTPAGGNTSNVTVARNTVYNFTQGIYIDAIATDETGVLIYNNVIYNTPAYKYGPSITNAMNCLVEDGESLSGAFYNIQVGTYNNTLACGQLDLYTLRLGSGSSLTVRNNVMVNPPYGAMNIKVTTGVTLDNNYYSGGDASPIDWNGTAYKFAAFKAAGLGEANGVSGTANLNSDYSENANSDTRNRGANLSSIFTTDALGALRPASGAWDEGAFQFGSSAATPPAPPTGLTVVVQ